MLDFKPSDSLVSQFGDVVVSQMSHTFHVNVQRNPELT